MLNRLNPNLDDFYAFRTMKPSLENGLTSAQFSSESVANIIMEDHDVTYIHVMESQDKHIAKYMGWPQKCAVINFQEGDGDEANGRLWRPTARGRRGDHGLPGFDALTI